MKPNTPRLGLYLDTGTARAVAIAEPFSRYTGRVRMCGLTADVGGEAPARSTRTTNGAAWRIRHSVALAALLALGLAVRADGISEPPLDASGYSSSAVVIRQYHSALLARAYFLEWRASSSRSERQLAAGIKQDERLVEPPLVELTGAAVYLTTGHERLWIPRFLMALAWLAAALFVARIATRITSPTGSLVAAAIVAFMPFGIIAGRSFQPDPLLVAATLGAALAVVRYGEAATPARFAVAVTTAAAAALVKPGWSLFLLVPLFVSVSAGVASLRRTTSRTAAYGALAAVPSLMWIAYGEFFRDFLHGQGSDKLEPRILLESSTWRGWLSMIGEVLGPGPGRAWVERRSEQRCSWSACSPPASPVAVPVAS